jgi:hypothetical protein
MSIAASAVLSSLPIPGFRKPASGKASVSAPLRQQSPSQAPSRKWPFPPAPRSAASLDDVRKLASSQIVSRRDMLVDVLLVAAWGIAIPALMWLGAAAGF